MVEQFCDVAVFKHERRTKPLRLMCDVFPNPFIRCPGERPNQPNRTLYKNPKVNFAGRRFHGLVALITTQCKTWPIGNSRRRPVLSRIPSPETGLRFHGALNCRGKVERRNIREQRIACDDNCIHKSSLRLSTDARDYCRSRLTCSGKPSSPQTSMSGRIVGKAWIVGKDKFCTDRLAKHTVCDYVSTRGQ
jgi:hypothetical protein